MISDKKSLVQSTVLEFLSHYFTPWNLHTFSETHTQQLFAHLEKFASREDLLRSKASIKEAILLFFNKLGNIEIDLIAFRKLEIKTEITPNRIQTYTLLKEHEKGFQIIEGSNLLVINETITQHILESVKSDYDTFRDDIRATLPYVVNLGSNYAILFGRSRITVRTNLKESTSEKRSLGLPTEDLQEIVQRHFENLDEEIPQLMKESIEKNFNFQTLTNEKFESTHIQLLQQPLIKIVSKRFKQDSEVIKALANYILRQQFDNLHKIIAKQLLKSLLSKHPKAERFLNFYTQGNVSLNGIRYQMPKLEDREGTIWSLANITNVALQYQKYVDTIEKKSVLIDDMSAVIDSIDPKITQAKQNVLKVKMVQEKNIQELRANAEALKNLRLRLNHEATTLDANNKKAIELKIQELESTERDQITLKRQYEQALGVAQKTCSDLEYKKQTTIERHDSEIDRIEEMQRSHKDIESKYDLMLSAIVKALTGKKSKI